MRRLRQQPPVHSPLPAAAIFTAALRTACWWNDLRAPAARLLEREYAATRAVLCGSGTQALDLALRLAARLLGARSPVALPAYGCYDMATAAVGAGAMIHLYDVDPATLAPDLDSLEGVLADGARIVVAASLYGLPVDWDAISRCAARHGAVLIEDAAQGHGGRWRGRPLGSLGELSILSFGRGKGWTGGRGGALLLRGTAAREVGQTFSELEGGGVVSEAGILSTAAFQWLFARPALYGLPAAIPALGLGATVYRDPAPPQAIPRAAAALLVESRRASAREARIRLGRGRFWLERVVPGPNVRPILPSELGTHGFLRLPLRLSRGLGGFPAPAQAVRLGIVGGYPSTLTELPAVRARLLPSQHACPGAAALVRELVTLPTHSGLTPDERRQVLHLLNTYAA